jgi:Ni/Co efflux regulator RcnB
MAFRTSIAISVSALLAAGACLAAEPEHGDAHGGGARPEQRAAPAHPPEPHPGPTGYQRVTEPPGWNARPATVDRGKYQHNYQAARSYHIGPYRPPHGWVNRHWGYGEVLPRAFWAPQYLVTDYWLFALEVPPAGYEWVRYGNDALLIDINSGEVLQAEYGVFA